MVRNVTIKQLLDSQKKIWDFKVSPDQQAGERIVQEQLASLEQISLIGSVVSIPLISYSMYLISTHAGLSFFIFGCFCVAVCGFLFIRNYFREDFWQSASDNYETSVRVIELESIVTAICFSSVMALPMAFGHIPTTADPALLALGTIIIGGFTYGSIPRAQAYFISISTLCTVSGYLISSGVSALSTVILFICLAVCVDYIYRIFFFNFAKRYLHAEKLKENADTVKLLLHDYAEQSSDWLWELDEDQTIINPSDRFATAVNRDVKELEGMSLVDLFADSTERNALAQSLMSGAMFRDISVPIEIDGETCWWKLSGRQTSVANGKSQHIRGVASDITSAKRAEDRVTHLAHFDSLTDLPNRALFNQSLQRSIARMHDGRYLAALYLDLDHFKAINDTMGHGAGDLVLKAVANRLESSIGIEDVVARLGGDEFAIALRNIDNPQDAEKIAADIVEKLKQPVMVEGQPVNCPASIGIAVANSRKEDSVSLLKHADIALYHAKENGRACVSLYNTTMGEAVRDRREIEMDLRGALQHDQLELHYQPLVNIESSEILGYEALLRWHHPEKGMIMPDSFIPIAEETGLIVHLGEWVIRSALQEVKNWPDNLCVAVNLSPTQMRSNNLLPTIVNALAATGVAPNRLELEITETVFMNDSHSNIELLHKIRALGVRIALDDFGTGYSSLNYLRSFPFDKIKIDRCFVDDIDSREDCRAIIRAVTGLASSLGMVTTAEGVERDGQLSKLKEEGCQQVQGYLFSKAMPAADVEGRVVEEAESVSEIVDIAGSKAGSLADGKASSAKHRGKKRRAG